MKMKKIKTNIKENIFTTKTKRDFGGPDRVRGEGEMLILCGDARCVNTLIFCWKLDYTSTFTTGFLYSTKGVLCVHESVCSF